MKNFRDHFWMFLDKLRRNENFAMSRFSDGEMFILQNIEVKLDHELIQVGNEISNGNFYDKVDFKHFDPNEEANILFRNRLIEAFKHNQPNYFKGLSCPCCVGDDNFKYQIDLHGGDDDSLTWANIWVNGNYHLFIDNILTILYSKKCVLICNETADISRMPYVVKDFRVGYNAMINDYDKIDEIRNWISTNSIENHVFLFSAASFSNLAIYELYRDYPNNTYIDIGTTLAPIMKLNVKRSYIDGYWNFMTNSDCVKICNWG